ncbi:cupin domain-containing protein [Telluribacter sp. SYSU D00476]|uniref:cupin domain-containing protein n=1 Tax=Telluribacter sp. SYSU D00476 TaxID=2811430 RepID=UPI001FF5313C|nr:cupin domain-containing protein [Telluribacter sp. SYSU D00476]
MATAGEILENTVTGERILWLKTSVDTEGRYLQYRWNIAPKSRRIMRHYHSYQTECIRVEAGKLTVECNGYTHHLQPGDTLIIPKGQQHQWWNPTWEEVQAVVTIEPALNTEVLLEQLVGLCNDGQLTVDEDIPYLQQVVLAEAYDMKVEGLPTKTNTMSYHFLRFVANILGYKEYYPKYSTPARVINKAQSSLLEQAD